MQPSESGSDNDEGFFIPRIKVDQPMPHKLLISRNMTDEAVMDQANDLVFCERPADFKPRLILTNTVYRQYPSILTHANQSRQCHDAEEMIPLVGDRPKQKRYFSLKAKYQNNPEYKCVYSKIENNEEFDGYIFSLENTTDYNAEEYMIPMAEEEYVYEFERMQRGQTQNTKVFSQFDSNFQSGNLLYAFEIKNKRLREYPSIDSITQYDLIMQNDTNTKGYNQWFYFSFRNQKQKKVRFNIVNFIKKKLMFLDGVRPVGLSRKAKSDRQKGWRPIGTNISYRKSYVNRQVQVPKGATQIYQNYYTLSFDLQLPFQEDQLFIAMNYPYTYTDAINFVEKCVKQAPPSLQISRSLICHTISNNAMPCLRIREKEIIQEFDLQGEKSYTSKVLQQKGKIVCLGRQHPGQSVGSFVLQSFVQEIIRGWAQQNESIINNNEQKLQQSKEAKPTLSPTKKANKEKMKEKKSPKPDEKKKQKIHQLLKHFELIIIPMVNPDGVIYGNFRTNLAGFDLNRQWIQPNRWLQPEIFFLQKYLNSLNNVCVFLDFHGHSKKFNSFIYACIQNESVNQFRLYPWIFNELCQLFSIKDCTYSITPDKFRTARINVFKQIKKPHVYTLETSFFGFSDSKTGKNYRLRIQDLQNIGKNAAKAIEIMLTNPQKVKQYEKQIRDKSYLFDQWAFFTKQDPGSQSNPSQDELNPAQRSKRVMSDVKSSKKVGSCSLKAKKKKKIKNKDSPRKRFSSRKLIDAQILSQKHLPELQQKKIEVPVKIAPKMRQPTSVINFSQPKIAKPSEFTQKILPTAALPQPLYSKSVSNRSKQLPPQQKKSHSNLLDTSGYLKLREQKLFEQARSLRDRISQHQLQIISVHQRAQEYRDYHSSLMRPTQFKYSHKNLISDINSPQQNISKNKMKQKIYIIKENKVVNSFTRVNDEEIKKRLQKEIQSRTTTLKKCQNILRNLSKEVGDFEKDREDVITNKQPQQNETGNKNEQVIRTKTYLKPLLKNPKEEIQRHIPHRRHSQRINRSYNL